MAKNHSSSLAQVILLFAALFVTTKSFYVFYGVMGICVFTLVFRGVTFVRMRIGGITFAVLIFLIIASAIRIFYYSSAEDLKELIKFLFFFLIIWSGFWLNERDMERIFSLFVLLNFLLALSQFLGFYGFGLQEISNHYNADKHIEGSLSYSVPRALGFSSGPGQQSVIGLFFFSYFLTLYFWGGGGRRRILLCAISLGIVALSQSKTALIAFAIGSIAVILLILWRSQARRKLLLAAIFVVAIAVGILGLTHLAQVFPEYGRIVEYGLSVSSFQDRYLNWLEMIDVFRREDSLILYLFGVGRSGLEFYGLNDLPFDSDYVYFFVNFGVIGIAGLCVILVLFIFFGIARFGEMNFYGKFLVISLLYAIPAASALNYFIEPRLFLLQAVIISCFLTMARQERSRQ